MTPLLISRANEPEGFDVAPLERALPAWIAARRWYRTKTRKVRSARIKASFPIGRGRVALVDLALDDETVDTYVLPLAIVRGEEAQRVLARRPHAVVMAMPSESLVVDALALEPFLGELLAATLRGVTVEDSGARLRFRALSPSRVDTSERGLIARLVDAEQTNTSAVFDERYVAKILRKLDPGESPEVEMGRFLTAAEYAQVPALVGWIDVQRDGAEPATIGVIHRFVENRGSAWAHGLAMLGANLNDSERASAAYAPLAQMLGRRVGEMHVALASRPDLPAFAPEPFPAEARASLVAAARRDVRRMLDSLGARSIDLTDAAREGLAIVRSGIQAVLLRLADVESLADAGVQMRVHGDLHLGQILFTGTDFVILDFEGEPARPLAARKGKRSPLVDVAGILRSLHYAVVTVVRAQPSEAREALAPWATEWHRAMSTMVVRGWLDAVEGTPVIPADPAAAGALLELFLLERCVYEVGYEMDSRPDWVDIPLEGLRDLLAGGVDTRAIFLARRPH